MSDFTLKKGDTLPRWRVTLKNGDGSTQPLTGATVIFRMKGLDNPSFKFENSASVIDEENGLVEYAWRSQDTLEAGNFLAEFVAMYGSDPMTFPNGTNLKVRINDNLG